MPPTRSIIATSAALSFIAPTLTAQTPPTPQQGRIEPSGKFTPKTPGTSPTTTSPNPPVSRTEAEATLLKQLKIQTLDDH